MGAPLMKTRRRFLAESAVLLSGLFVPGAAHAWGWRRRIICPPCPCPPACPPVHMISKDLVRCQCLAPVSCYGQLDGMFYYSCVCCTSSGPGTDFVDSSYPDDLHPPANCETCSTCTTPPCIRFDDTNPVEQDRDHRKK